MDRQLPIAFLFVICHDQIHAKIYAGINEASAKYIMSAHGLPLSRQPIGYRVNTLWL